jgi:hypothetical protein
MTRILALLAVLAVIIVALRPREKPAVMHPAHDRELLGSPPSANISSAYGVMYRSYTSPNVRPTSPSWNEPEDGVQPSDPYPTSLLR